MSRKYTNKILNMVESMEGDNTIAFLLLRDALNYMSEADVEDFATCSTMLFEAEEAEEAEEDNATLEME